MGIRSPTRLLDEAFKDIYGDDYNAAAVQKITGKTDKVSQMIKQYKNERYPSTAITVDLLTTGIDVPKICHLVFLRRVRSRILYEQMIGRATRRCDEIGKTEFKIYDPVDIYAALEDVNTMKPLVKNPDITLAQLLDELSNPASYNTPAEADMAHDGGTAQRKTHADDVLAAVSQKVMRVLRKAEKKAEQNPKVKDKLAELEQHWGGAPAKMHEHLRKLGPKAAADFISSNTSLLEQLDTVRELMGTEYANGYSESSLKSAWRNATSQDIAASIIGYIRRAAIGEALVPFDQRVANAMQKIYTQHSWSPIQRKWLERIAKQLTHEVVIDREFVNHAFAKDGGAQQLEKILSTQLPTVLDTLADELWPTAE